LSSNEKTVIVAPLDWGLGHAARCVPIINALINKKCKVVIASSGAALQMLRVEFPSLTFEKLPEYNPTYHPSLSMVWSMGLQLPHFVSVIKQEQKRIEKLCEMYDADLIISDNRYGAYSKQVSSVIVCHQLHLLMPPKWKWMEKPLAFFNHRQLKNFKWCWVPDFEDRKLSGKLSEPNLTGKRFIGPLSRVKIEHQELVFDVIALLSGPEPQRSILEEELYNQLKNSPLKWKLVRGVFHQHASKMNSENFLTGGVLNQVLNQSRLVISRSGYSTVMDLAALGKKAFFIPTPGQTEQEYLAEKFFQEGIAGFSTQGSFSLQNALQITSTMKGFTQSANDTSLLNSALNEALSG
jgi:uncharacterized protein (TIGR00661 family)